MCYISTHNGIFQIYQILAQKKESFTLDYYEYQYILEYFKYIKYQHTLECLSECQHLLQGSHDGAGADPPLPDWRAWGCRLVRCQSQR